MSKKKKDFKSELYGFYCRQNPEIEYETKRQRSGYGHDRMERILSPDRTALFQTSKGKRDQAG